MRILHAVEFYEPSVGGAQEVVRQVSTRLASRGHEMTVATTNSPERSSARLDGVNVEGFNISGNSVRGMRGEVRRYQDFVVNGKFDVVMTYAAQQWTTDALLPVLTNIKAKTFLATCGFSGLSRRRYRGYFDSLPIYLRQFDGCIVHSETYQDARFLLANDVQNTVFIPNGADEREFTANSDLGGFREMCGVSPEDPLIVTIGTHTGRKGHNLAISAFLRSQATKGGALVVIGNKPRHYGCYPLCKGRSAWVNATHSDRRVIIGEFQRPETVQALLAADVFLFCSQIECSPLVLFEAAAAGTPFVSVDIGNSKEIAEWTQGGAVVGGTGRARATAGDLATALDAPLANAAARRTGALPQSPTKSFAYSWEKIAMLYEDAYVNAMNDRNGQSRFCGA